LRVADFDFELPRGRIAQAPADPPDAALLLIYDRASGRSLHQHVRDFPQWLRPGDVVVVNDTKVVPSRLLGERATGGRVEVLILERQGAECSGFVKPARKLRAGVPVVLEGGALTLLPLAPQDGGRWRFRLTAAGGARVEDVLERVGRAPLPPYIERDAAADPAADRAAYQTMFAIRPGAVAAPTAGLHFTPALAARIEAVGAVLARITLHVGEGTFAPVRSEEVAAHRLHAEEYELPEATAAAIAAARARGGRVFAVGTTAARTLETCARDDRRVQAGAGRTGLFLHPGKEFRVVDALLTNFHLPRSTLLMLVAAFMGREQVLAVYRDAVARGYRFYSYGDAMLVL
jgi:S-adenosylmethionine:tRNA ribosyltransferase-isomerase